MSHNINGTRFQPASSVVTKINNFPFLPLCLLDPPAPKLGTMVKSVTFQVFAHLWSKQPVV